MLCPLSIPLPDLLVFDVSIPAQALPIGQHTILRDAKTVHVSPPLAFVTTMQGLFVVDVAPPFAGETVAFYEPELAKATSAWQEAGVVYVGHDNGFDVLDFTDCWGGW